MTKARFDDLTTGRSFELGGFVEAIECDATSDVRTTMSRAEAAAAAGRWVAGFVAYEAASGLDPALPALSPPTGLPLVWFGVFDQRIEVEPVEAVEAEGPEWVVAWDEERHARSVARVREHLEAGATYQVNLTVRALASVPDAHRLYEALAGRQRGAYNAYFETGDVIVASASPELFFERDGGRVVTRPMKGTMRRGRWPEEDAWISTALCHSAKDQAEHVMIVDLLRNDLGRVAVPGTVRVGPWKTLERYPTVWQLTSTVGAQVPPGTTLVDLFAALFPCGSVTGAPKRRTMQIIAAEEDAPRGVYCGATGYIEPGAGRCRFSVGIRTATVDRGGRAVYGSGGGITWNSDPATEWDEVLAKCRVLEPVISPGGLFETLRYETAEGPVNLDLHLDRLESSSRYFGLPFQWSATRAAVDRACTGQDGPRRVRIVVESGRVSVSLSAMPEVSLAPARLAVAVDGVDSRDVRLFHKVTERARYESARASRPDADDVMLWNERGEVTETTIANLVVRLDGRWWTPALDCGLLPGVERRRLLAAGTIAERVITLSEARDAQDLAVVNSLRGWRPAVLL